MSTIKLNGVYKPEKKYNVIVKTITFNQAKYIKDTLNGIAIQNTTFPFVNIVLEDNSTDGEQEVIKTWLARECDMSLAAHYDIPTAILIIAPHKININCTFAVYFHKKNLFQQKNIRESQVHPWRLNSKYEALCEGDDYWTDPYKLQKQVDFLEANPEYSMCFHNVDVVSECCNLKCNLYSHLRDKDYSIAEFIETWTIPTCSVVYRSYISQHIPHNDKFAVGDNVLFTTCAIYGKIRCINERMGCYRRNGGGWTNGQGLATKFVIHYEAMIEAFPSINRQIFDDQRAEALVSLLFDNIKHLDKHCFSVLIQGVKCYKLRFLYLIVKRIILRIVRCLVHDNKY